MKKYFLMIKQHCITNLKYLCVHHHHDKSHCHVYKGSGKYWTKHIHKHGNFLTTKILFESYNKELTAIMGIYYSKLWNVVDSKEFANLTVECVQTTAEPILRQEVRLKSRETIAKRRAVFGSTEGEKYAIERCQQKCWLPEIRQKAATTIKNRIHNHGLSEKEQQRNIRRQERQLAGNFTEKELQSYKICSERQRGKTMQERLNDSNYVDKRKGKTAKEIYGNDYKNVNQVDSEMWLNGVKIDICSVNDLRKKYKLSFVLITKARSVNGYTVKRIAKTKHTFKDNDNIRIITKQ